MKKFTLLVLLIIGSILPTHATHLMGGEIIMTDLGNQEFAVTLTVYRDTIGIPMADSAIINFDGPNGNSFNIHIPYDSVISGNLLPMYPYGVEVYLFRDTVTLSSYGQWDVSWSNCCRNAAILNLSNPLGESMFLTSSIVIDSASANSSPFFLVPAAIFLPVNTSWAYNPLPFDPDGDSLHWSIDQPLTSSGTYCAGYVSPSSDPTNVFSIDPITGTISWTADLVGNYVASILVDQYRNGVWVGEIRRDMQFIVVSTSQGTPLWSNLATIPTDNNNNFVYDLKTSENFNMELIASHTDPSRTVYMGAFSEIFNLTPTNATFTETISNTDTKGVLSWTPEYQDLRDKPYPVVFRVSDNFFTDDITVMLNVRNALSVSSPENKINAKVFPNPASDFVYLEITDSEQQTAFLNVYALNGSKVLPQKTIQVNSGANMFIIESKSWTPGTYIIHVQGDNGLNLNQMLIVE